MDRDQNTNIIVDKNKFFCRECEEEYLEGIYCRCNEHEFFDMDGKGY